MVRDSEGKGWEDRAGQEKESWSSLRNHILAFSSLLFSIRPDEQIPAKGLLEGEVKWGCSPGDAAKTQITPGGWLNLDFSGSLDASNSLLWSQN